MAKMNYGKRFGSSAVGSRRGYDEHLHKGMVPLHFLHADEDEHAWNGLKGAAAASAKKSPCYLGAGAVVEIDEGYEAKKRLEARISQCIDVLTFGIQEVMASPSSRKHRPRPGEEALHEISMGSMIELIRRLCAMIGRDMPTWGVERRPGIGVVRRCIDCGTELTATEKERCPICEENSFKNYKQQEIADAKAERERIRDAAHTAKVMGRIMARIKRRRGPIDERYRGYSSEDAGPVDAGGRGQDQRGGGSAPSGDCAGHSRHAQGRDDGGAFELDGYPAGAGQAAPAEGGDRN